MTTESLRELKTEELNFVAGGPGQNGNVGGFALDPAGTCRACEPVPTFDTHCGSCHENPNNDPEKWETGGGGDEQADDEGEDEGIVAWFFGLFN